MQNLRRITLLQPEIIEITIHAEDPVIISQITTNLEQGKKKNKKMCIKQRKYIYHNLLICLFFCFWSCTEKPVFEKKIIINDPFLWHKDSIYHLNWENTDTSSVRDLFFTLRNNTDYPYYNLYLFFKTIAPDGAAKTDTLLFYLQNPETGEYYGRGYTGILDNKILFQEQKINQIGVYQYSLEQGMRDSLLPGILDLGLRIENVKIAQ